MSRARPPENIEIASLRKKQQTVFDPMKSGAGTPWEDRGTHGTAGAFFKTCLMALTSPAKLFGLIRRPETINDARGFLIGISGIWAISALIHFAYFVWKDSKLPGAAGVDTTNTAVLAALTVVAAGGGCFFLFKIYTLIYSKLASQEKDSVLLPDVLIYNVSAYALGPSLLALIPFVGPPLAGLWLLIDLIVAGASRLRLRVPAAVIDALLSLVVVLAIAGAGYFVVEFLIFNKAMDFNAVDTNPLPPVQTVPA
jgi:hypothetical protein